MTSTRHTPPRSALAVPLLVVALIAIVVALASGLVLGTARAQTSPESAPEQARRTIDGEWRLAISDDEARRRIDRGIAAATEGLPPLTDTIAARILRDRTPLIHRVRVVTTPARIAVHLDARPHESVPGVPYHIQSGDERVRAVQHFREGTLEQVFETPRGTRWNTFRLGETGDSMTMEAVVQSERLPAPLRFSLPFRRAR